MASSSKNPEAPDLNTNLMAFVASYAEGLVLNNSNLYVYMHYLGCLSIKISYLLMIARYIVCDLASGNYILVARC